MYDLLVGKVCVISWLVNYMRSLGCDFLGGKNCDLLFGKVCAVSWLVKILNNA